MFNELLELRPLLVAPTPTDESRSISILFLRQPQEAQQWIQCATPTWLPLQTEKERQHRPGFCPTVAKGVSKGKPTVESNGDGEATSCKKEAATTASPECDRPRVAIRSWRRRWYTWPELERSSRNMNDVPKQPKTDCASARVAPPPTAIPD